MNSASGHDGQHVDCLPCEIAKIPKPRWWTGRRLDGRDIVIAILFFLLLTAVLWW